MAMDFLRSESIISYPTHIPCQILPFDGENEHRLDALRSDRPQAILRRPFNG
jgi:hypothetical protein